MTLYLTLLNYLLKSKDNWLRYYDIIDWQFLKSNHPELYRLYRIAEQLFDSEQSSIPYNLLELEYKRNYPRGSDDLLGNLLQQIRDSELEDGAIQRIVESIRIREGAARIAQAAIAVSDGLGDPEAFESTLTEYLRSREANNLLRQGSSNEDFVTNDLNILLTQQVLSKGLAWRLGSLNKNLGPLRKGDFGFVFARPETGKTTFLASELSFMAEQCDEDHPVIWFNNEEQGGKVMTRIYQATLNLRTEELVQDVEGHQKRFHERVGNKLKLVDDSTLSAKTVEKFMDKYSPSLVVFDQIDKLRGFQDDRSDLELAAIYQWGRQLAKNYCPVIGICQAGATGDGKKWLTMNDVDNSKTGKQAEADWILGIGKTYDTGLEYIRYFHLSKNKLTPGPNMDFEMRHGKWEVRIDPYHARYADL